MSSEEEQQDESNELPEQRSPIPEPLRYWRIFEDDAEDGESWLEGEAVTLESRAPLHVGPPPVESPTGSATGSATGHVQRSIRDQHDDIIVVSLHADRLKVLPGETATYQLGILNNGRKATIFHVHVEGWIDERWITVSPVSTPLQPGQRATLEVVVRPTRAAASVAGEHALAIVTRSPDYPARRSCLAATLVIEPYDRLVVGELRPRRLTVGWNRRAVRLHVPVANQGNHPTTVRISGQDITNACRFEFLNGRVRLTDEMAVELGAGQTTEIELRILSERPRLFGLRREMLPFRLLVSLDHQTVPAQVVPGRLENRPLVGPWHLATALTLVAAAGLLTLIMGMGGLLLFQAVNEPAAVPPAPPPQVIAVMLNNAPSTSVAPTDAAAPPPEGGMDAVAAAPGGQVAGVPIVQAEQVSAPAAADALPAAAQPSVVQPQLAPGPSAPPPDAGLTYGEMFQLVASRYDLDWRMLAAQAYIESNFDALALGADGDMGLMQVLPATWREWAPVVDASDPFDAYSNALVAAAYLDHLRAYFGDRGYADARWMLVAYNWGPDKLLAHLDAGQSWEQLAEPRRRYAERVLEIATSIPLQ